MLPGFLKDLHALPPPRHHCPVILAGLLLGIVLS
jgi:hypothetical protein